MENNNNNTNPNTLPSDGTAAAENAGGSTKRKRSKTGRVIGVIALSLAGVMLLSVVGVGAFVLIKLSRMSRNAVDIMPKVEGTDTAETAEPPELIVIEGDPEDLTQDYDAPIDPSDVYPDPIYQEDQTDPDILNILLMGDDGRDVYDSGRSDVMIVLSYNTKTNDVKLISFLRDTWIYIPGRDTWNRINTAYRFGGVGLAINTINTNFDLDIQYYMLVHFADLVAITDSLGGIDVELSQREAEYLNAHSGSTNLLSETDGLHHLDGIQTFTHSRNRSLGNGDWSRTERQRAVLKAFHNRAKQEKSASAFATLAYSMMSYVETNMSPWQMISIGTSIVFGESLSDPETGTMPCTGSWTYAYEGRMAVIHIDIEKNKQWLHEFIYGKTED